MKELIEMKLNVLAAQNGPHTRIRESVQVLSLEPHPRPTKSEYAF